MYELVRTTLVKLSVSVTLDILVHTSLIYDKEICADLLESMLDRLTEEESVLLIVSVISKFPDVALLSRYFERLISFNKIEELFAVAPSMDISRMIMQCACLSDNFDPMRMTL